MDKTTKQDERYRAARTTGDSQESALDNDSQTFTRADSLAGLPPTDHSVEQIFTRKEALGMPRAPVSATDSALASAEQFERSSRFLDPVQRHKLIAEAAYFRAVRMGAEQDTPMQNWLAAQAEIDQLFEGERFTEE